MIKLYTFLLATFLCFSSWGQMTLKLNLLNKDYFSLPNLNNPELNINMDMPGMGEMDFMILNSKGSAILKGTLREKFIMTGTNFIDLLMFKDWDTYGTIEGNLLKMGKKLASGEFKVIVNVRLAKEGSIIYTAMQEVKLPPLPKVQLGLPKNEEVFKEKKIDFNWTGLNPVPENLFYKLRIYKMKDKQTPEQAIEARDMAIEIPLQNINYTFNDDKFVLDAKGKYVCTVSVESNGIEYSVSDPRVFYTDIPKPKSAEPVLNPSPVRSDQKVGEKK